MMSWLYKQLYTYIIIYIHVHYNMNILKHSAQYWYILIDNEYINNHILLLEISLL